MFSDADTAIKAGRLAMAGLAVAALGLVKLWKDERKRDAVKREILAAIRSNNPRLRERQLLPTLVRISNRWKRSTGEWAKRTK